tara:strand:- start:44 stop:529 length:486 start_codon:yes stop_codon:yes gene_type:complete
MAKAISSPKFRTGHVYRDFVSRRTNGAVYVAKKVHYALIPMGFVSYGMEANPTDENGKPIPKPGSDGTDLVKEIFASETIIGGAVAQSCNCLTTGDVGCALTKVGQGLWDASVQEISDIARLFGANTCDTKEFFNSIGGGVVSGVTTGANFLAGGAGNPLW